MKKIIFFTILTLVISFSLYTLNTTNPEDISAIKLSYNADHQLIQEDHYSIYFPIIQSKKTDNISHKNTTALGKITFEKNYKKEVEYSLFLNETTKKLIATNKKYTYVVNSHLTQKILSQPFYDFLYSKDFPTLKLYDNQALIDPSQQKIKLNYKKANNKFYPYNNEKKSNATYKITVQTPLELNIPNSTFLKIQSLSTNRILYEQSFSTENTLFIPETNGMYAYTFTEFITTPTQKGTITTTYTFHVDNPPKVTFSNTTCEQGNFLSVTLKNIKDLKKFTFNQPFVDNISFYSTSPNEKIAYIPISYRTDPGIYNITYRLKGKTHTQKIKVLKRNFKIQYLYISKETMNKTSNQEAYEQYYNYYYPSRYTSSKKKYYTENFILPVSGRLTTEFGERRFINDRPTSYHHAGLDIAADTGTPVKATNRGKITLSMFLDLTGNTIVIDHGQGLFSVYFHLNSRRVEKDQIVERGEIIGEVGSTGRSTGAHLHFTMSFYSTNIEPGYVIFNKKVTKSNFKDLFKTNY